MFCGPVLHFYKKVVSELAIFNPDELMVFFDWRLSLAQESAFIVMLNRVKIAKLGMSGICFCRTDQVSYCHFESCLFSALSLDALLICFARFQTASKQKESLGGS